MPTSPAGPLQAAPGDRLVIRGHHVGESGRDGEIIEVFGEAGAPPYLVRWEDNGHVSRLYPGSDAYVQHFEHEVDHAAAEASPAGETAAQRTDALAAEWEAATPPTDS